jgi:hypothetical protein
MIGQTDQGELERWASHLRTHGRCLKLGIPLEPLALPRSRTLRRELEREAAKDHRVRVALDQAKSAAARKRRNPDDDGLGVKTIGRYFDNVDFQIR